MSFHPFQGSALFGPIQEVLDLLEKKVFKVSIPFREVLYSDRRTKQTSKVRQNRSFHPFQGSALFGHERAKS